MSLVKHLLLEKVQEIRHHHDKYVIDEKALKSNKTVLRLPSYHCELNAIEMAWSVVKNHVKKNNTSFKINDVRQLLIDGIKKVTPDMWANFVSHAIKEENKLCTVDNNTDELLDQEDTSHVMQITGDTSSSDDSD
ncbi:uncharacterized protein LOC126555073 [Aphis gossypii]|uniref:uncharacterized protein LOC126555073 n=1 Tax=Aphis gossypii TaxID=80765 RepID=UPI002158DEA2|nr:uncharacterized protein LOC126555073 [Aphis gossypii]